MSRLGLLDQAMFKLEEGGMSPMYMCGAMIMDTIDSPYPVDGEIMGVLLLLASEAGSYINGQRIAIDGGMEIMGDSITPPYIN